MSERSEPNDTATSERSEEMSGVHRLTEEGDR